MQVPALQVADALFTQLVPHAPQFAGSIDVFSQNPLQEVCPVEHVSVSPLFWVRYSTTTLALLGAGAPEAQAGPDRKLARRLVPAGNVSVPAPESMSV